MYPLEHIKQNDPVYPDKIKLIRGGKDYFDLLTRMIHNAKESIHLQTYIYDDDETGKLVANALKAAAARGVAVYIMADGYASQVMSQQFIDELRGSGIHFRFFQPLLKSKYFYFGRRLHHKVVVTDSRTALVGGVNITNRYNDMPGKPAWLDFALYAEGAVAGELNVLCWKTWNGFSAKTGSVYPQKENLPGHVASTKAITVEMRRNDWVRRKNEIYESYRSMFEKATSHITIICSYFLPGKKIRRLLAKAAARGVSIKVILAGRSDVPLTKPAERWLYDWLLRNNIQLYEYQPSVLHAKLAICDSEWLTIGSYNINDISAYASIELNLDVYDRSLAIAAEQMVNNIISNDTVPVTLSQHKRSKNIFRQLGRWLSYQFIRVSINLLTFYYKQKSQ